MKPDALQGLDLLSTAVLLLDSHLRVTHLNPAAENLFRASRKSMVGQPLREAFALVGLDTAAGDVAEPVARAIDDAPAGAAEAGIETDNANRALGHGPE